MPIVYEGSINPGLPLTRGIVSYRVVTPQATVAGAAVDGTLLVSDQPRTVEQAVQLADVAVKRIPTATAPAVGNLPTNARPGEQYSFDSNPSTIYVFGADYIWRALVLVTVV